MTVFLLSILLFLANVPAAFAKAEGPSNQGGKDPLMQRHPHSILTPHRGILSESDLALDAQTYTERPYNPQEFGGSFWQCFPVKFVSVEIDRRRDTDPMGRSDVIVTMCDFLVRVRGKATWNEYWDRRGRPVVFCDDFMSAWRKLTHDERFVCLNGEAAGVETRNEKGVKRQIRGWVWNKFKTHKGCYSFFDDACPK